jgi:hypothetical protein
MKIESKKIDRSTRNGSQGLVSKNGPFHPTGDRGTQFFQTLLHLPRKTRTWRGKLEELMNKAE